MFGSESRFKSARQKCGGFLTPLKRGTLELAVFGYFTTTYYPSERVSGSKWHVWFASRRSIERLSTWQMIAASCPTALGDLVWTVCSDLRAWCREHSAVTAIELFQLLDLACWTLFRSSCANQTSPTDCSDDSWRDTLFGKRNCVALWLLIWGALENTYLGIFTYIHINADILGIKRAINKRKIRKTDTKLQVQGVCYTSSKSCELPPPANS